MEMSKKPEVAPTEVRPAHVRRTFSSAFKARILQEAEGAEDGQIGALLRRHGLTSTHLSEWRKARKAGLLPEQTPRRGPPSRPQDPSDDKVRRLERELAQMTLRAERAELLVALQKKVSEILCGSQTPNDNKP